MSIMKALLLAAGLHPLSAADYQTHPEKVEVGSTLLEEARRPTDAPPKGRTAWDLVEASAYLLRKSSRVYSDARAYSYGHERRPGEWENFDRRLRLLESVYRESVYPAMRLLAVSMQRTGLACADVDLALKERELTPQVGRPGGPTKAMNFAPSRENILGLRRMREEAEHPAVQAEELLEKGLRRLRGREPKLDLPFPDYMNDLVAEAERSLEEAAAAALKVAQGQVRLSAKKGVLARAIAATAAYGGMDGKGPYEEKDRVQAVLLSNEAKREWVANEYGLASRIEEVRTLDYLLETFGQL